MTNFLRRGGLWVLAQAELCRGVKETQKALEKLLVLLESAERDQFASLDQSHKEYRLVCERPGKGSKQIERVISSLRVAESMGFKDESCYELAGS
jgi:hypothetical protein